MGARLEIARLLVFGGDEPRASSASARRRYERERTGRD